MPGTRLFRLPASRRFTTTTTIAIILIMLLSACSGPNQERPINATETVTAGTAPSATASPDNATPASDATVPPTAPTGVRESSTPAASPTAQPDTTETVVPTVVPTTTPVPPAPDVTPTTQPTPVADLPVFDAQRVTLDVQLVASGFTQPIFVTHAGDGTGQLYVLEKIGVIKRLDGTSVLDIRDRVIDTGVFTYEREQGLLGMAFHPRFEENGFLYVHYNDRSGQHVFSRFTVGSNGLADPGSERILLTHGQPEVNFNGGMLVFGHDGYLYIGLGTGGTAVELQDNSQNLSTLLGKILRIDVDNGDPYGIPPDNPFVDVPDARPEIWVLGVRNPYRFSFDRVTNDMYIGGPGQFKREWIEFQRGDSAGGENFGWPVLEGSICWEQWRGPCDATGFELPIAEYETYVDGNCVVIGGYVYRGERFPLLQGAYLFGDFCSGRVWTLAPNEQGDWIQTEMMVTGTMISSFGEDEAGELYLTDINGGGIYRIVAQER